MFQVYHSNQLDLLKDLLVALIERSPLDDPFESETILVQSPGMAQWLQLQIAEKVGISANIDFPLPASFIWQQFKHILKNVPDKSPFNKESMSWHIMQLLPLFLDDPDFDALLHYLKSDDPRDDHLIKRFQLSQKIADLFDQYLVYRPKWIESWEKEIDPIEKIPSWIGEQKWQVKLWNKLSNEITSSFKDEGKAYHRANLYKDFLTELKNTKEFEHLPKRIFVFGISSLPESYLASLLGLSQHCEIHFFLSNPCQYYWGDIVDPKLLAKRFALSRPKLNITKGQITPENDTSWQKDQSHLDWAMSGDEDLEVGNPLLASMGKMGRDFLYQLYSLDQQEIDAFVELERSDILQAIKSDILELSDNTRPLAQKSSDREIIKADDDSLTFKICHSIMREVEVLHDSLLKKFENESSLTPKDIIVMVPNIDLYAPYVKAVFSSVERERYIPFCISDVSASQENPILKSFLQLLNLNQTRYNRADLLSLLEIPSILQKFKITNEEFELVQIWINESGIRWGLNAQSADLWSLPKLTQNTWIFGLKRMLLGYAMSDERFDGISPYDEVQGLQGDLLGRFIDFIDELIELEKILSQTLEAKEWQEQIYKLIDLFYFEDEDNTQVLSLIRNQLDSLAMQIEQAGFQEKLSVNVLIEYLKSHLNEHSNSQKFLAGQVNFCTLMPMRSIPFKVIALLGMNDGQYPRTIVPMGFDLMNGHRNRGDRSRREEDRYLFLEALVSAQNSFYISYIGKNISDNSDKMPSVLVSELINYCKQSFVLETDLELEPEIAEKNILKAITHVYPMQSFSNQYFNGEQETYNSSWWDAKAPLFNENKMLGQNDQKGQELEPELKDPNEQETKDLDKLIPFDEPLSEIQLNALKSFFRSPSKAFFNNRLNVYFEVSVQDNENDEPFALNNLENYFLKNQIFERSKQSILETDQSIDHSINSKSNSIDDLYLDLKAQGELPQGEFAPLLFDKNRKPMEELASLVASHLINKIDPILVNLELDDLSLVGELSDNYEAGLLRAKTGKIKGKEILSLWIEHLALCAISDDLNVTINNEARVKTTSLFAQENGIYFEPVEKEYAYEKLSLLLKYYKQGMQSPLPFFIQSSYSWCEAVYSEQPDCFYLDELSPSTKLSAQNAAIEVFANTRGFAEGIDPYISRSFEDLDKIWDEFEPLALAIFMPIFSNLKEMDHDIYQKGAI